MYCWKISNGLRVKLCLFSILDRVVYFPENSNFCSPFNPEDRKIFTIIFSSNISILLRMLKVEKLNLLGKNFRVHITSVYCFSWRILEDFVSFSYCNNSEKFANLKYSSHRKTSTKLKTYWTYSFVIQKNIEKFRTSKVSKDFSSCWTFRDIPDVPEKCYTSTLKGDCTSNLFSGLDRKIWEVHRHEMKLKWNA